MGALARIVVARRRLVVVVWALALLAALPVAARVNDELSGGGYEVPGSESERARTVLEREVLGGEAQQLAVVVPARAGAELSLSAEQAAAGLRGAEGVREVRPVVVSDSGRTAVVPFVAEGSFDDVQKALPDLRERIDAVAGAEITGQAAAFEATSEIAAEDLSASERISLPITLAILVVAFLSVVAAGLPLGLALVSLVVTFAALVGVAQVIETSVFVRNTAVLLGLGLSIDYALFVVTRYREELDGAADRDAALRAAVETSGRAVLFSGLTIAISLASLFVVGVDLFTSMAIGAILASLIASAAALTLLPAVLALLGPRIERLSLRRAAGAARRAGVWRALADLVLRRRLAAAVGVVAVLLAASAPLLDLNLGFPSSATRLPDDSHPVAAATERIEREFGPGVLFPFEIVTRDDPRRVAAAVGRDPGVRGVLDPVRGEHGWWRITAYGRHRDNAPESRAALDRLRGSLSASFPTTLVGGQTAQGEDLAERILDRFPAVVLTASLLTFVLLFAAFRSIVVPIKAILTNLLIVGAALGLLTAIFQWAGGSAEIAYFVPLFLFAVLFGLSMDYEVFLISRIREEFLAGASNDEAIARGVVKSARPITLAAVVMITVFAASAASSLEPFQQLGVAMSVAVLLDATAARTVLVPAAMALLGARNWWAPRFLPGVRAAGREPSPAPERGG